MTKDNLKQKATTGILWTAVQKYSTMIVSFISGIILARLLTPADYGCIGMLSIFMALAENFIDGGFGAAIIQKKELSQSDLSTVFFFNLGMSVLLYALIYISAPAVARFYDMPILCDIFRVQGLVLFVYALNIIQSNQIRKSLHFKKLAKVQITTSITSLIITVTLAYNGWGVWSLVVQHFVVASVPCVYFWVTSKWKPTWEFSFSSFRGLFSFGFFIFLTHILRSLSSRISGLLIGKVYSASTMGYYTNASKTEDIASMSISSVLIQTTYPLYSAVQDDRPRLINMIKRITTTLSFFTTPLMCVLILVAKPIFIILYSDTWLPCVPYFQILCVSGLATCLQAVNYQAISAIGKSKVLFGWESVRRVIDLVLQVGGLYVFGLTGLLVGRVISTWIGYGINITMVSNHIGYKNIQQIKDLSPAFIVAAIAVAISYFGINPLGMTLYIDGVLKAIVFITIYASWAFIFKPAPFTYALGTIKSIILKK